MNITTAYQTSLSGASRTLDNATKQATDSAASGKPEQPELASGREVDNAVASSTLNPTAQAVTTKVVTDASEVLGTNIDVRV